MAKGNLIDLGNQHGAKLLADRTRRADLDPKDFSDAYVELGKFLSLHVAQEFELEEYVLNHCQGQRKGIRIKNEEGIAVLCLMRAGFYLAQGFRSVLRRAQFYPVNPKRGLGLSENEMGEVSSGSPHTLIIIDSVINTGGTIIPIFQQATKLGVAKIIVAAAVSPVNQSRVIAASNPEVMFYFARTSENTYVGKGTTDTGNRLFGTPNRG
jgi:uracil phosphoribosyltransferase